MAVFRYVISTTQDGGREPSAALRPEIDQE